MKDIIPVAVFWDMLNRHDWFYSYSDDHSVWSRGSANESRLEAISKQSEEHANLFSGFKNHYFSGKSFSTPKAEKPDRPADMRVRLILAVGEHKIGSVHKVMAIIPHGGHSDDDEQYRLEGGEIVIQMHTELVAPDEQ